MRDPQNTCSFCGKHAVELRLLLVGQTGKICNECVGLCVDIIGESVEIDRVAMPFCLHRCQPLHGDHRLIKAVDKAIDVEHQQALWQVF